MILAFTGTRQGMTTAQRAALPSVLAALPERVLHGGADGADTQFHDWICKQPIPCGVVIHVYPAGSFSFHHWNGFIKTSTFFTGRDMIVHPYDDPLARNRLMAQRCDALLATPATAEEENRSGTWATIRYARKAGKLITIIEPDGTVREEKP